MPPRNGAYSKFQSRKFILGGSGLVVISLMGIFALVELAKSAADAALIMGAWGTPAAVIMGLYHHYDVKASEMNRGG